MAGGSRAYWEVLDEAPWGPLHWKLFAVFSDNYFFDGLLFAVTPLLLYLVAPPSVAPLVFALNLTSEAAGAIVLGWLSDRYGRLRVFAASMALEAGSLALLLVFYSDVPLLALLSSLITFCIGGEFSSTYALLAELTPARHRGKAMLMATNFWNLGSTVIAVFGLLYARLAPTPSLEARYLLLTALGIGLGAGAARFALPESPRWLALRGMRGEAERVVRMATGYSGPLDLSVPPESGVGLGEALRRYAFRFAVLAVVTLVVYITYVLVAFYAPYAPGFAFGEAAVARVVFYANLGSFLGAFMLLPLIDRTRRWTLTLSTLGGTLTAAALLVANSHAAEAAFYAALFTNMVFSEWAWAGLSALQSELFPTGVRSSVVGMLVGLQGAAGALIVYTGLQASATALFLASTALWAAGLAASTAWHLRGTESARRSVEELSATHRQEPEPAAGSLAA
ncbi:MAG: MFS transporter [Desulfurococcales archaeon]|nr:MFS transporter [Desulfurococcales archaeon]